MIKYNFLFIFKKLRKWTIESFQAVSYFSIQVNPKLDVRVQSVTSVIVQSAKSSLRKFRIQSVINDIV